MASSEYWCEPDAYQGGIILPRYYYRWYHIPYLELSIMRPIQKRVESSNNMLYLHYGSSRGTMVPLNTPPPLYYVWSIRTYIIFLWYRTVLRTTVAKITHAAHAHDFEVFVWALLASLSEFLHHHGFFSRGKARKIATFFELQQDEPL